MQTTIVLDESAANSDDVNLAHLFSSVNRKMMAPVDKKGNAQNFHVQVRTLCDHASNELRTTIKTANTGYVTKQAVKAWYRIWRQMIRDSGTTMKELGPYGSVFKPKLQNTGYTSGGDHWGGTAVRSGEWNYSDIVIVPPSAQSGGAIEANEAVDSYNVHLIGDSANQATQDTVRWTSVGMIKSWIESRIRSPGAAGGDVSADAVFGDNNPLIQARTDSLKAEAVLDEIRDLQQDEAPYVDTDLDDLFTQAVLNHSAADTGIATITAPCGWMRLETSEAATVEITLLGISDM